MKGRTPGCSGFHARPGVPYSPAMPKRRHILILLACALAVGLYALRSAPPEPSYEGKSLSQCLDDFINVVQLGSMLSAERTVTAMGTNAIPFLVRCIESAPASLDYWGERIEQKAPKLVADLLVIARERHFRRVINSWGAAEAFSLLRPVPDEAIVKLTKTMMEPDAGCRGLTAARALAHSGERGIASLREAQTNQNTVIRDRANTILTNLGAYTSKPSYRFYNPPALTP